MTQREIAELREDFIRERTKLLTRRVSVAEKKLYETIFKTVIKQFELDGGRITASDANKEIINRLNKVWEAFKTSDYLQVIKSFAGDMNKVQSMNELYFKIVDKNTAKVERIGIQVTESINKSLGISESGKLTRNGYLESLIEDNKFLKKIQKETFKAVSSGEDITRFSNRLKKTIVGNDKVNGGLVKHFNTFVHDTYAEVDRNTQKLWAGKLGLKAFIYAGGLKRTSRPFCQHNNGKVFTTDEAKEWKFTIGHPEGVQWNDEPYNPIRNMGGYGCRHLPNFISNDEAIQRRPELARVLG